MFAADSDGKRAPVLIPTKLLNEQALKVKIAQELARMCDIQIH
jgi:hypothetical protein